MAIILVTGATSGIGLATAISYAKSGDLVYAGMREISHIPQDLNHPSIHPLKLDVNSKQDIENAVSEMQNHFGMPDVLINNAGINFPSITEECSDQEVRSVFDVNFFAPLALCRALLPSMRARGSGTIIMVSSLSAALGLPNDGAYAASKAALNRASESLAYEVEPLGIKVIIATIGAVKTNLNMAEHIPPQPIADYALLKEHFKMLNSPESHGGKHGEEPAFIAKEIVKSSRTKTTPLFHNIDPQAKKIIRKLQQASSLGRREIVTSVTDLRSWLEPKEPNITTSKISNKP